MLKIIAASAALFGLAACVSGQTTEYSGKRADYSSKTTIEANEDGEEVICRKKPQTGSRVRMTKRCATQAEWDAYDEEVQRRMKDMTNARQGPLE
jgi:hypothetical protein